jgi:hypothetical protein
MQKGTNLTIDSFHLFGVCDSKTAAIYSPTFTQYHRRGWA